MLKLVPTADNSYTVLDLERSCLFHSSSGALGESQHVFIYSSNLETYLKTNKIVQILEIGFGTGLNAYLTSLKLLEIPDSSINYWAFEPHLLNQDLLKFFYTHLSKAFKHPISLDEWLDLILHSGNPKELLKNFNLKIINDYWSKQQELPELFDIIYYDPFAPKDAPELWQDDLILHTLEYLRAGGTFVTYSITGKIKRLLKEKNFEFYTPKGFAQKREMLVIKK